MNINPSTFALLIAGSVLLAQSGIQPVAELFIIRTRRKRYQALVSRTKDSLAINRAPPSAVLLEPVAGEEWFTANDKRQCRPMFPQALKRGGLVDHAKVVPLRDWRRTASVEDLTQQTRGEIIAINEMRAALRDSVDLNGVLSKEERERKIEESVQFYLDLERVESVEVVDEPERMPPSFQPRPTVYCTEDEVMDLLEQSKVRARMDDDLKSQREKLLREVIPSAWDQAQRKLAQELPEWLTRKVAVN
jgi:hypothetical protein